MNSEVNGYGIGLAQWDGGRRVSLINEANKEERSWKNIDFQISYMFDQEGEDSSLIKQLMKQTDLNQTTEQIMRLWERAGNDESLIQRLTKANYWVVSFRSQSTSTCPTAILPNDWTIDQPIDTSGYTTTIENVLGGLIIGPMISEFTTVYVWGLEHLGKTNRTMSLRQYQLYIVL